MSAISDCVRFQDYIRSELRLGRHPFSFIVRQDLPSGAVPASEHDYSIRRPVTDSAVHRASEMRQAGKRWDEVEKDVGFTRPALVTRAKKLGLSMSKPA